MPFLQVMSNRASTLFSFDNLANIQVTSIAHNADLCSLMQSLNIARTAAEENVINSIPMALQRSIVTIVKYALEHDDYSNRVQISFTWSPAYEYGLHVWEAHAVAGSPSAITIHLEGPYPDS